MRLSWKSCCLYHHFQWRIGIVHQYFHKLLNLHVSLDSDTILRLSDRVFFSRFLQSLQLHVRSIISRSDVSQGLRRFDWVSRQRLQNNVLTICISHYYWFVSYNQFNSHKPFWLMNWCILLGLLRVPSTEAVDTIVVTIEDYYSDFLHLRAK